MELVPHLGGGVRVEGVIREQTWALVRAAAQGDAPPCPSCGSMASRVHSSYQRRLHDAAIGGRATTIELTVRRFFCDNQGCPRLTFVEQVAGLSSRYARRSFPARALALAVAFALRAGRRAPAGSARHAVRADEPAPRDPGVWGTFKCGGLP